MFIILGAIFSIMLLRYTNQKSLVFNYPVNMRPPGFKDITGCFVNNVLFKVTTFPTQTFQQLVTEMIEQRKQTKKYQYCPLIDIVQHLRDKKILQGEKFFNVDFYEAYLGALPLCLNGLSVTPIAPHQYEISNDIGLAYQIISGKITFKLEYKTALFDEVMIDEFIHQFHQLINKVIQNPVIKIYDFPLISEKDFYLLTKKFNTTTVNLDTNQSICQLIEETAKKYPEKIALQDYQYKITYHSLNIKANQLANYLRKKGITADSYIGVYLERSIEMIVAMLAILKAGGAYIPLDPKYPQHHLDHIITDSNLSLIITQSFLTRKIPEKISSICFDTNKIEIDQCSSENLSNLPHLKSAAYVIYTSGSTGKPKGVIVSHDALVNHNIFVKKHYEITEKDKILQFSSMNFDISIEEIFPALLSGATLILYPDQEGLSFNTLLKTIKNYQVTCINLPTAFWHVFANELNATHQSDLKSLRLTVVGGEQPQLSVLKHWNALLGSSVRWINTYGPTEATIISSVWEPIDQDCKTIPMGKPISNCQLYVTDPYLNPVPFGVTGELYISGDNLARCYLNQPGLTAEKFIPNPFSDSPGKRMYKTGDLVRYQRNGVIEYVGRTDHQVKIRGHRVELSEIETTLLKHNNIKAAVVIKCDDGELMVFIVVHHVENYNLQDVKSFLTNLLPNYMVPSYIKCLENIPLTVNGKIDKKVLLKKVDITGQRIVVQASNAIETKLVELWKHALQVSSISVDDNFFDLGAHSLLLLKVHKNIEETLNIQFPVITLFQYPTIKFLASYINDINKKLATDSPSKNNAKLQRQAFENQRQRMKKRVNHE